MFQIICMYFIFYHDVLMFKKNYNYILLNETKDMENK